MNTHDFRLRGSLAAAPARLSLAALRQLIGGGSLTLTPTSPLAALAPDRSQAEEAEREAARTELLGLGLAGDAFADPAAGGRAADALREALTILAAPRAEICLSILAPPEPPAYFHLFARDHHAALGGLDGDALVVGGPLELEALARALVRTLDGPSPLAVPRLYLWPCELQVASLLWRAAGRSSRDLVPVDVARATLRTRGLGPGQTASLLDALAEDHLVELRPEGFAWRETYADGLALLWSGHFLEILVTALPRTDHHRPTRLLFVGPRPGRALAQVYAGTDLAAELGTRADGSPVEPPEDGLLVLQHLPAEVMGKWIRAALAGKTPAAA